MASQLRGSFKHKSPANDLELDSAEVLLTQESAVSSGEEISNYPGALLNLPPNESGSCAKQELQRLWEMFTRWLQPERQSKEQMIAQLVLGQFLLTGRCKDKFALKEQWESSGRDMGRFMEGLTDECLQTPPMVHVSMQGQEALFAENMSLKEVISTLKQQQSGTTPTQENARTPLQMPRDLLLVTGHGNRGQGHNSHRNYAGGNGGVSSLGNEVYSLRIIQRQQCPKPEEGGVAFRNPRHVRRASQGSPKYQDQVRRAPVTSGAPMAVQPGFLSRPEQSEYTKGCGSTFMKATEVNGGRSINNAMDSFLGVQRQQYPEPQEGHVSYRILQASRRANRGTPRSLDRSPRASSSDVVPMEVAGLLSRPEQPTCETVPVCQNPESNSTCEGHQERLQGDPKPYKCEQCPMAFKCPYNLAVHCRKHWMERSFFCTKCLKGFNQASDLRVHELIHNPEKPFTCSTCKRSFSHKTNLQVHERFHTGEKPYTCPLCSRSFCQSSTYHRHLRNHKSD